ncbi:putative OB-fold protein [Neobacillus niacini]|uniref:Zn-ribbon domain-containing OB-fold protein n=1 Tax=Neobacillus niacini TaxID=86668 RepID=UPI002857B648|nr:OB-fold domain-containing protein [Neobacillus niacini]MDR7076052.1 putative OB-fold protein [Neobacillus niacini]
MAVYKKPLPMVDETNKPFWEAAKNREIKVQYCNTCNHYRYPVFSSCPLCLSTEFQWKPVSKTGEIWSYGFFHKNYFQGFENALPYNVAVIKLDDGPKLFSNIVEVTNHDLRVGMRVEAFFEDITNDHTIIKFKIIE